VTEATAAHPLVGTILADTYQLTRQVAVGGMGELYEATHLRLSGRCAVKILQRQFASHQEVLARFQREAEITSGLRHPNIVSVLDFNVTPDGRAFLVMEYLEGRDLATELAHTRAMPLPRVLTITEQVVAALTAAHAHGVIHRDLKPQNLFVSTLPGSGREIVKVLDFGISKVREARTKLTREHSIIGTPQYMAPEQALGNAPAIDHRTDQFALAAIVYEMLTGREAFQAEEVTAILYQVVHEQPPSLAMFRPDLPARIENVLFRALAKSPDQRFASIDEFGRALANAATGAPTHEPLGTAPTLRQLTPRPAVARSRTGMQRRRDTTFGASTVELYHSTRLTQRRSQRGWLFAVATFGLLGAGAAAYLSAQKGGPAPTLTTAPTPEPAPAATPPPPPAAPPPAAEVVSPEPPPTSAPVVLTNAPANLRVRVDGAPVEMPLQLPRKPGRYRLDFESPGRLPQAFEVDGMALRHELPLAMPEVPALPPARRARREVEIHEPEAEPPAIASPSPAPVEPPPAAAQPTPSLIEDVDDAPVPTPKTPTEKPPVPLIDDI
jgi:eukaryotic-like serine/threonine-protein kinase